MANTSGVKGLTLMVSRRNDQSRYHFSVVPSEQDQTIAAIGNVFRVCIAWYKHKRGWESLRQLCQPETSSRVGITVECIRPCKHNTGKKKFFCFYKIASSKTTTREKVKKIILLIKTYLLTTLIWQWHFSTGQSQLTFQNLVMACLQLVYLYVTQPCLLILIEPHLLANQSARVLS